MVIDMSEQKLVTLLQLRQFLDGTQEVEFRGCGKDQDRYRHIEGVLRRFGYARLKRQDKGLLVRYLMRTTGYSRPSGLGRMTPILPSCVDDGVAQIFRGHRPAAFYREF